MEPLPSFWPSAEDQAVMATFFEDYPMLAYGMCYVFGALRQAGKTSSEAARQVRWNVDTQQGDCPCGWRQT